MVTSRKNVNSVFFSSAGNANCQSIIMAEKLPSKKNRAEKTLRYIQTISFRLGVYTVDLTKGVHPRGIERPWLTIAVVLSWIGLKARWEWSDAAFVHEKNSNQFLPDYPSNRGKGKKKSE
jgi:hypothetical protein